MANSPENLILCFNCGMEDGHYLEFEDNSTLENPPCPNCKGTYYTIPKFYVEDMTLNQAYEYFKQIAYETGFVPLFDYKIKGLNFPGAIIKKIDNATAQY